MYIASTHSPESERGRRRIFYQYWLDMKSHFLPVSRLNNSTEHTCLWSSEILPFCLYDDINVWFDRDWIFFLMIEKHLSCKLNSIPRERGSRSIEVSDGINRSKIAQTILPIMLVFDWLNIAINFKYQRIKIEKVKSPWSERESREFVVSLG
jgi:hypothetical protein